VSWIHPGPVQRDGYPVPLAAAGVIRLPFPGARTGTDRTFEDPVMVIFKARAHSLCSQKWRSFAAARRDDTERRITLGVDRTSLDRRYKAIGPNARWATSSMKSMSEVENCESAQYTRERVIPHWGIGRPTLSRSAWYFSSSNSNRV
jgi:hypothetical protein